MHIFKLLAHQPMRLLLTIILTFFLYDLIPLTAKQLFLSISLSLKEILMFMIPVIIFSSVYSAFSKIRGNAFYFVILLLVCIILSNFISVGIAGVFGHFVLLTNDNITHKPEEIMGLMPLWQFAIPKLVSNNVVLLTSLILACISQPKIVKYTNKLSNIAKKIVKLFLVRFFVPLLPIFIFGFLIKLLTDDMIGDVLAVNPAAFFFMILVLIVYLGLILAAAVLLYKKKAGEILRNIAAPAITANAEAVARNFFKLDFFKFDFFSII